MKQNAKPVLKWAGGKGMLLPQLRMHFPKRLIDGKITTYIEPFVGGGAMFFEIANNYAFEKAYLFDINPELVILYNVIKENVEQLIQQLKTLQNEYDTTKDRKALYYERRDEYNNFNKKLGFVKCDNETIRRAALTIFLNRTCFNGLFRVSSKGKFNVPMGKYSNPCICDEDNLRAVSSVLQKATITQGDFELAERHVNKDTFIYYDPPYRPLVATSFTSYAVEAFNDDEQVRLKEMFARCDKIGALQMLSNSDPKNVSDDPFFDDLYADYNIHRVFAKRLINSNAEGRSEITELLITNYDV